LSALIKVLAGPRGTIESPMPDTTAWDILEPDWIGLAIRVIGELVD